jgi:hypothetical protein
MAKPFYSLEEVCTKLGKTEEEVRDLVRDGTLREFRDAGKVFFKSEDVDELGSGGSDTGGMVQLEPVDDAVPTLADTSGGTSIIGLEPVEEQPKKEDTAIPGGQGVFADDELEVDADPMAATQVTAATGDDQVQLDSGGSGSGLLDLTREADDTSLGAELLDDILPSDTEPSAESPPMGGTAMGATPTAPDAAPEEDEAEPALEAAPADESAMPAAAAARTAVPAGDPSEGIFGGLMVGALLLISAAASVAVAGLQGFVPEYAKFLGDGANFMMYTLGGAAGVLVLTLLLGWVFGRAFGSR